MKKLLSFIYISLIILPSFSFFTLPQVTEAAECNIVSAKWSPSGDQPNTFYKDGKTKAYIVVKSIGCIGNNVDITVVEADSCPGIYCDEALVNSGLRHKPLEIKGNNFTIPIRLGEEECETGLGFDCDLYFTIKEAGVTGPYKDGDIYNSWSKTGGELSYECDGACNTNAELLLPLIANDEKGEPKDLPTEIKPGEAGYDGVDGNYELLAPLPGLKTVETTNIGKYFNIIFKVAIGLCGVLAVIMLIINGVSYMMSESFTEKARLKEKITGPILGLMIAIGSFVILNTIDPALTGSNGLSVDGVEAVIEVRDRADDPQFMSNLDSFDISNIKIDPSNYSDPAFLGYLAHQQGAAGASAILWSAKKGYAQVPANNPFAKGNIAKNMKNNFNANSAQKTIGTSELTTANFLKYWATKVAAVKRKTSPAIPGFIDTELVKAANDTQVDILQLRTMCRIEAQDGCTTQLSITKINSFGYSGLFQLSQGVFTKFGKKGGTILNAYDNAFAGAQYYKSNLSGVNKNWTKINN